VWAAQTRANFLLLSVLLVLIGTAAAWLGGVFEPLRAALIAVGVVLAHVSVNLLNEHSDHRTGIDASTRRTPFSGGSGTLQAGHTTPAAVLGAAGATLLAALAIGLYLVWSSGWPLLAFIVCGGLATVFYTSHLAPPPRPVGLAQVALLRRLHRAVAAAHVTRVPAADRPAGDELRAALAVDGLQVQAGEAACRARVGYDEGMTVEQSVDAARRVLEADERLTAALLFGSAAAGRARADSDLDIGVVCRDATARRSLAADFVRLLGRVMAAAGRDVHLLDVEEVGPTTARQVFLHGRPLFDREPRRTADVLERTLVAYADGEYHRRLLAEALDARAEAADGG